MTTATEERLTDFISTLIVYFVFRLLVLWGAYSELRSALGLPYLSFIDGLCVMLIVSSLLGLRGLEKKSVKV